MTKKEREQAAARERAELQGLSRMELFLRAVPWGEADSLGQEEFVEKGVAELQRLLAAQKEGRAGE